MSQLLSFELPESVADLIDEAAFSNYTTGGKAKQLADRLSQLSIDDLFPGGVSDEDMAQCSLSAIWLLHNFLDRSHDISQEIHTREGSFWHAIMHRLEGDFWNSKYWYRKVGKHSVYNVIDDGWNPEDFVDQCEAASESGSLAEMQSEAIQEWKALFEYCYNQAQ